MDSCEFRYYIGGKGEETYLGSRKDSISSPSMSILEGLDNLLSVSPPGWPTEGEGSRVYFFRLPFFLLPEKLYACWVSKEKPIFFLDYMGRKKVYLKGKEKLVHKWRLPVAGLSTPCERAAPQYINAFLERAAEEDYPPDPSLFTLYLVQETPSSPVFVYSIFRRPPENYRESLRDCPDDCYPVELVYFRAGWFLWVKKESWDRGHVDHADLTFYRGDGQGN